MTVFVAVAVEVDLFRAGVGVNVLVGGRIVEVDVRAGAEVYAVCVALFVSADRDAATLGGMNIPINKRPIALTPTKSLIDRYEALARNILLLIPIINFRKGFPIE